jgi:hypothetical protein
MTNVILGVFGLGRGEIILIAVILLIFALVAAGAAVIGVIAWVMHRNRAAQPPVSSLLPVPEQPNAEETRNLAGAQFHRANMTGADLEDVNLSNARFHNVNLSNVTITAAQMGGAAFRHIGPPPDAAGHQERQRPVRFEEMMLCDSTFRKVDLSNVRIAECDVTGMTIDGVLVTDMVAAFQREQGLKAGEAN